MTSIGEPRARLAFWIYLVTFLAFIALGFPKGMLGVAWPSIAGEFGRQISELGMLGLAGSGGYFVLTMMTGNLARVMSLPALVASGVGALLVGAIGLATAASWPVFIVASVVGGAGSGLVDGGLNAFAAKRFRARELNWLHGCFGIGAALGPAVMTPLVVGNLSWRYGFVSHAAILVAVMMLIAISRRHWSDGSPRASLPDKPGPSRFAGPGVVPLTALSVFMYAGLEVTIGQWSFTLFTVGRGISTAMAGNWVTFFYLVFTAGRILFGLIADRAGPMRLVRITIATCGLGLALIVFTNPALADVPYWLSAVGLGLVGVSLAPMMPLLIGLTPQRVYPDAVNHVVGFQVGAAAAGAFSISGLTGLIVERTGVESIGLLLVCVLAIFAVSSEALERLSATKQVPA